MKRLLINLVSESEFTVQGHGVHTAYMEMRNALESQPDIDLLVNSKPLREVDITHIHTVGFFAFRRLISRYGGKRIVSAHIVPASLVGSIVGARFWGPFFKYYLRWFYNRADAVIAVSPATKDDLIQMGVKRPIYVLNNSIDTCRYKTTSERKADNRRQLKICDDKFVVVGNGQVQPRKRFDVFCETAKQMPSVQFIWVGGIPFKAAGADFVKLNHMMKHTPKNLVVTGVVPQAQARMYMQSADMMFMPSEQETFGLAIIEGAASGLPVLVRDIHDYDKTFGDLVLRGTDDDFTELIDKLRTDKKLYQRYQENSANLARKYDSKEATKQLIKLYRSLID